MEDMVFASQAAFATFLEENKAQKLGYGIEGTCYRVGDMTYKVYNNAYREMLERKNLVHALKKYRDVFIDNVYFIRRLVYVGDMLACSVTNYADGVACNKISLYEKNLDTLIQAFEELSAALFELSAFGISTQDPFLGNILYNDQVFQLIDTAGYSPYRNRLEKSNDNNRLEEDNNSDYLFALYKKNALPFMKLLLAKVTNHKKDDFIFRYLKDIHSPYQDFLNDEDLLMEPDLTIASIRDAIQEGIGRKIDTFSSCKTDLVRTMRRK